MSNTCTTEYIITGADEVLLPLAVKLTETSNATADSLYNLEEMAKAIGFQMTENDDLRGRWEHVRILNAMAGPVLSFIEESAWKPTSAMTRLMEQSEYAAGIEKVYSRSSDWDAQIHQTDDTEGLFFPEDYAFYYRGDRHIGFCLNPEDALQWCRKQYPDESFELEDFKFIKVDRA